MEMRTIVPGASLMRDQYGKIVYGNKGRALWNKAKPHKSATHFNSEASRRKYLNGELSLKEATHEVPVYRGLRNDVYKDALNTKRRKESKNG